MTDKKTHRTWKKTLRAGFKGFLGLWFLAVVLAGTARAESIAVAIINAGGDPVSAVNQAILAGEDPVEAAAAAAALVPDAAVGIAQAVLSNAPELAYDIAFVVGKVVPEANAAALINVITGVNPGVERNIVSAIVSKAPSAGNGEVLVVNVVVDPDTNQQEVKVSTRPGQGETNVNVVVEKNYGKVETPNSQQGGGNSGNSGNAPPPSPNQGTKPGWHDTPAFDDKSPSPS